MSLQLEDLVNGAEVTPWKHSAVSGETFGLSLADLKSKVFPAIRWVVADVLPEGCTILAGRPKLGKSWLALDIAIRTAATYDGYVLGDKLCTTGDALYLALEDNERRLQLRAKKLVGDGEWPARLKVATEWPRANQGGLGMIERWAASVEKPTLVVVDVLTAFRGHPETGERKSTYATDYEAVQGIRDLGNQYGFTVLIVHHVRKGVAEDPIEAVSGTLGLAGAADTILVLNRTSDAGVTLYGRGRDIAEFELALEFVIESCRWNNKGEAAVVRRGDQRNVILGALKDNKVAMSAAEIADVLALPRTNVRQLLFKMCKEGQVVKVKRGLYAIPESGCDLEQNSDPDHNGNNVNNGWSDA